jgi:hypothetical protein
VDIEFLLACSALVTPTFKIFTKKVPGWYKRGGMSRTDHQIDVALFYVGFLSAIFFSILYILILSYPDKDLGPLTSLVGVTNFIFTTWWTKCVIGIHILLEMFVPAD